MKEQFEDQGQRINFIVLHASPCVLSLSQQSIFIPGTNSEAQVIIYRDLRNKKCICEPDVTAGIKAHQRMNTKPQLINMPQRSPIVIFWRSLILFLTGDNFIFVIEDVGVSFQMLSQLKEQSSSWCRFSRKKNTTPHMSTSCLLWLIWRPAMLQPGRSVSVQTLI